VSLDDVAPVVRSGPSVADVVESRDLARRVASAVEALSADQREVIVLKEYEGLTFPRSPRCSGSRSRP